MKAQCPQPSKDLYCTEDEGVQLHQPGQVQTKFVESYSVPEMFGFLRTNIRLRANNKLEVHTPIFKTFNNCTLIQL